jgi:hypothetical protein
MSYPYFPLTTSKVLFSQKSITLLHSALHTLSCFLYFRISYNYRSSYSLVPQKVVEVLVPILLYVYPVIKLLHLDTFLCSFTSSNYFVKLTLY